MFCPRCSAKNSTDQSFCRSCGFNLEKTSEALLEQFPKGEIVALERAEQRLERFGKVALGGFLIILGLGILGLIYAIVTKMILSGEKPLIGSIVVLTLIFGALGLTYVVFREGLNEKRKALRHRAAKPELSNPVTGKVLYEGSQQPITSIVEDTTDLLPVENRTPRL